jgi:hypothetical protein
MEIDHTVRDKTSMPCAGSGADPCVDEMMTEEVCLVDSIVLIAGRFLGLKVSWLLLEEDC